MKASQDEEEVLLAVEESLARKTVSMLLLKDEVSSSDLDQRDKNVERRSASRCTNNPGHNLCSFTAPTLCLFTMPNRMKSVYNTYIPTGTAASQTARDRLKDMCMTRGLKSEMPLLVLHSTLLDM